MRRRRYVRFSIGAILLVMTGVAMLVNREVQRAKAIETTARKIEEWKGSFTFRAREKFPTSLARFLPHYWSEEFDSIFLAVYSDEQPPTYYVRKFAFVHPSEFEQILQLGAINNSSKVFLWGTAINRHTVEHICKSASIEHAQFADILVFNYEIAELKQRFSHCSLDVTPYESTNDEGKLGQHAR